MEKLSRCGGGGGGGAEALRVLGAPKAEAS